MSEDRAEELQELREQAEHARGEPKLLPVSFTMSVLAVMVAMVTLLGHRTHTEEVVTEIRASDTWAEYQAKNIRYHTYGSFADVTGLLPEGNKEKVAKVQENFRRQSERYNHEKDELQQQARKLEAEVATDRHKADRYDFGEAMLEMGLVITSITLLTRRRYFWYFGVGFGALGLLVALSGFVIH